MRRGRARRAAWLWLVSLAVLPLASCRWLADEFTVLDRAGPVTERPDAPVEGGVGHP